MPLPDFEEEVVTEDDERIRRRVIMERYRFAKKNETIPNMVARYKKMGRDIENEPLQAN